MFRYYGLIINIDKIDTFYKMKHLPLHFLRKYDLEEGNKNDIRLIELKDTTFDIPVIKDGSKEKFYFQCEGSYLLGNRTFYPEPGLFKTERVTKISKVRFSNIVNELGGSFDVNNPSELFVNYLGKELKVNYVITGTTINRNLKEYNGETGLLDVNFDGLTKSAHEKDVKEIEMLFNFFTEKKDG